jgi:hypothetical protein
MHRARRAGGGMSRVVMAAGMTVVVAVGMAMSGVGGLGLGVLVHHGS